MSAIKYSISIMLLISTKNFNSYTNAINCVIEGDFCTFTNVITTASDPLFHPSAANSNSIKNVKFVKSSIYALTNELCEAFTKLDNLQMQNVSLQLICDNVQIYEFLFCSKINWSKYLERHKIRFTRHSQFKKDILASILASLLAQWAKSKKHIF